MEVLSFCCPLDFTNTFIPLSSGQPGFSRSSTLSRLFDPAPVLLLLALGAETRVEVLHVPVAVPRGAQHEVHVGGAAVYLEVVTAHLRSQVGRGPHADAPAG